MHRVVDGVWKAPAYTAQQKVGVLRWAEGTLVQEKAHGGGSAPLRDTLADLRRQLAQWELLCSSLGIGLQEACSLVQPGAQPTAAPLGERMEDVFESGLSPKDLSTAVQLASDQGLPVEEVLSPLFVLFPFFFCLALLTVRV